MNYTNGFDIDLVLPALQERLGWRQPTVAGSPVLNSDNLESISGRFFGNAFHALCTINNIKQSQEDPEISDDDFNDYLTALQSDMIMRSLNEVFRKRELIEQVLLYTRYGWNDVILPNQGQYAGWMIDIGQDQAISTQINFAKLYFDADVTFNLYLFQDGVRLPLHTIPVTAVAFQNTVVEFDNLVLPFKTAGKYYLLYNQAELGSAHAIRELVQDYPISRCFKATSMFADATADGSIFNRNQRSYPALPAGINLEIVTFRDHTQKIIRQANLFDEVQGLQMAVFAIENTNMSTRTNLTQRQTEQQSQQAFLELNQAFPTKEAPLTAGLRSRVIGELKRLRDTFFPPEQPVSMDMTQDCDYGLDSYERQWGQMVLNTHRNPGATVTTG